MIDGLSRTAAEESVKRQIDYDYFMNNPNESVMSMVNEVKDLYENVVRACWKNRLSVIEVYVLLLVYICSIHEKNLFSP